MLELIEEYSSFACKWKSVLPIIIGRKKRKIVFCFQFHERKEYCVVGLKQNRVLCITFLKEKGVLYIDISKGNGHWVLAFAKKGKRIIYIHVKWE